MILLTQEAMPMERILKKTKLSFLVASNPFTFLRYAYQISKKLRRLCKEFKPDLIHIQSFSGFVVIPPKGIPTVVTLHDEPFLKISDNYSPPLFALISNLMRSVEDFFRNLMLYRIEYLHATGTSTIDFVRSKFPQIKSKYIPNPTQLMVPQPPSQSKREVLENWGIPEDSHVVLSVGSLDFRKFQEYLVDIAEHMKRCKNIHFLIVGGTPNFLSTAYFKKIEREIASKKLENIHLTGFVSRELLHDLFHYANIFLSVSRSEACSLSVIEAAVHGLPIITTDAGAARDLFSGEATILSRYPSLEEVSTAIIGLLGKSRRKYSVVHKLSENSLSKELLEYYNLMLIKV